jgi:hypothetical protein
LFAIQTVSSPFYYNAAALPYLADSKPVAGSKGKRAAFSYSPFSLLRVAVFFRSYPFEEEASCAFSALRITSGVMGNSLILTPVAL